MYGAQEVPILWGFLWQNLLNRHRSFPAEMLKVGTEATQNGFDPTPFHGADDMQAPSISRFMTVTNIDLKN